MIVYEARIIKHQMLETCECHVFPHPVNDHANRASKTLTGRDFSSTPCIRGTVLSASILKGENVQENTESTR